MRLIRRAAQSGLLTCLLLAGCEEHIILSGPVMPQLDLWWPRSAPTVDAGIREEDLSVRQEELGQPVSDGSSGGCQALQEGDQLCLICPAGKELSRECVPASQACVVTSAPQEVCVECRAPSGQLLSKQCFPLQQTCVAQAINGKLCLVCKNGAGTVVKTHCEGGAGGG